MTTSDELDSDLSGLTRTVRVRYDQKDRAGVGTAIEDSLMILLPGECGTFTESAEQIFCNRETLGLFADGSDLNLPKPEYLLERHPIKAVAYARLNGYTPFFNNRQIIAEAYGYRQPVPQGPFPAGTDPAPASQIIPDEPQLPPQLAEDGGTVAPIDVGGLALGPGGPQHYVAQSGNGNPRCPKNEDIQGGPTGDGFADIHDCP